MDFVINMRICLLVIANYVYRANCRQHHWHNKRPKNPPTTRTVAPDAQLQSASKCKRSKPSTKTRHHSLPMDWTSILVRHFCRRIFCCTFPLRCIIWPLGCMKDSIERQRRPTCRSESQPASAPRSRWFGGGGNALVGMFCTGLGKMRILSVWPLVRPSVGAHSKVVVIIIWWGHRVWKRRKPQWLTRVCCVLMHTLQLQLNDGRGGVWRKRRRIILLFWKPLKAGNVG